MAYHITIPAPDEKPASNSGRDAAGQKSSKWLTYCIEAGILILGVLLIAAVRFGIYEPALVISRSMEPTLQMGDRLLIDHRDSLHGSWRRGDIVLFKPPAAWSNGDEIEGEPSEQLIKRIIGLPGETIEARPDGSVSINGRALRESYINPQTGMAPHVVFGSVEPPTTVIVTLGPDQYFVMGDNRGNSEDSRRRGPISDRDIQGRAIRRIGPWGRFGALPALDYDGVS